MATSPAERPCSSVRPTTNITHGPGTNEDRERQECEHDQGAGGGHTGADSRGPSLFRRAAAGGKLQSALPAGEDPDDDDPDPDDDPDDDEDPESVEEEEDDPDDESFEDSLLLEPCLSEPDLAAASFSRLRLAVP